MKYITKVQLKNFQSHKNTIIEFDNRLNVIVGASDSGKTSILRGVKWALYNDPSGDYFIREGESECSVTIYFSDMTKIKRYRSKSKNAYYTYDKDDNEVVYEAFGTSVPAEVSDITGIKKILIDKDNFKPINISDQLEGAFLLSEKNSVKANSIGYLVGVDIIDDTLRDTLKDSRNLLNKQKNIEEDTNKLKEGLLEYDYLDEVNKKINDMDKIRITIKNKSTNLASYKRLLNTKIALDKEKNNLNAIIYKLEDLHRVELNIKEFELNYNKMRTIYTYKDNYDKLKNNKNKNKSILNSLTNLHVLEENVLIINKLQVRQSSLSNLKNKLITYRSEKDLLNNKMQEIKYIDNIIPSISKIEKNINHLNKLDTLNTRKNNVYKSLEVGNKYFKKLANINISENKYSILNEKMKTLDKFIKLQDTLKDIKDKQRTSSDYLNKNKELVLNLSAEYKNILIEQKTCPLCFSEIDDEKAEYIIKQYK